MGAAYFPDMGKHFVADEEFHPHDLDVVVDYVVEEELPWFCQSLKDLHVEIRYVVLWAEEAALRQRLQQRGDEYLVGRSMELLHKLVRSAADQKHLLDVTLSQPAAIIPAIVSDARYKVEF